MLWTLCGAQALEAVKAPPAPPAAIDFGRESPSAQARQLARWIGETGDAAGKPLAIVDKRAARLYLFDRTHRLLGATPVLLGQQRGDHTVPGVGQRAQTGDVPPHERTTPAGRFESVPGRNLGGESVVWLDWGAAFAIHRLRPGAALAQRQARLATPTPADNRASLGCVVVPVDFYTRVLQPVLGATRGVVYVLPDTLPLAQAFAAH